MFQHDLDLSNIVSIILSIRDGFHRRKNQEVHVKRIYIHFGVGEG